MNFARKMFTAAFLCAGVLIGGSAAAQAQPRWTRPQATQEMDTRDRGASDQAVRLQEALERYREIERRGGWNSIPAGPAMGPPYAYECSRISALEQRLITEGYLDEESTPPWLERTTTAPGPQPGLQPARNQPPQEDRCEYTPALAAAVRAFQADRKVLGDGQAGKLTLVQLNRPVHEIVNILEHDVERWRNVSLDPSGTYVLVNIPFFELTLYERGREVMQMPVIVGQPTWQTPLFSATIQYIILNPEWGIPDTIAKKETWPTARRDPDYFRREGIVATGGALRQKPGPRNPLGRIKFMIPNPYDVYLHDTPYKGAFSAAVRALSHGCIRLGRPMDLANYLLRDDARWNPSHLQAAIASGATQQVDVRQHIPVHILYSTSRVNDEGRVELRPDVYGKNNVPIREDEVLPPRDEHIEAWP